MTSSPLLLLLLALAQLLCPVLSSSAGSLCILMYSLPGTVDYPFSIAYDLQLTYDPTPVIVSNRTSFNVAFIGNGTRTYTNRFGVATSTAVHVSSWSGVLYSSGVPFSSITFNNPYGFGSPIQLPNVGAARLVYDTILEAAAGGLLEYGFAVSAPLEGFTARLDPFGQGYVSSIPGFLNTTISASNINSLAADYDACRAPITFVNGLRTPTQPSTSSSAAMFNYSYTVSDGVTYSVTANLTFIASEQFAVTQDSLGNPVQSLANVTGTRVCTNLTSGSTEIHAVTGLQPNVFGGGYTYYFNNTFYPYSLIASGPGVYSINTAPFWDFTGITYSISSPVRTTVRLNVEWVLPLSQQVTPAVLTESLTVYDGIPAGAQVDKPTSLLSLQRQSYTLPW